METFKEKDSSEQTNEGQRALKRCKCSSRQQYCGAAAEPQTICKNNLRSMIVLMGDKTPQ